MKNRLSVRQLAVASFTGLLAPASAIAGMDWRGALLAIPLLLAAACCWGKLGDWTSGWNTPAWRFLTIIYIVWVVLFAGSTLAASAERITAPQNNGVEWAAVLIGVLALWLAAIKPDAFGRAAEIFYLAVGATLIFVLLFGGVQIKPERLFANTGEFWNGFLAAAGVGCCGVAGVLLRDGESGSTKWVGWSGAFGIALMLMSAVTTGVLSPTLAAAQERPFFLMTVGLGQTARVEGLISAVWLLAEMTLLGLLLQCGRKLWRVLGLKWVRAAPPVLSLLMLACALWFIRTEKSGAWIRERLPIWGLLLGGAFPALGLFGTKQQKNAGNGG